MDDRGRNAGRFARVSSRWNDAVVGLIGFLDNIRIWELAGDIPQQFYTFPTVMKILRMSISFSMLVALIGNIFDIAQYFLDVSLTPVWYALVFAFFYLRYYGSFGSFGISVYKTVMSTTIITLFLVDNAFKNLLAFVGELLKYSAFPDFANYLPNYGIQFYHFVYFVVLFIPKKKDEGAFDSKPLYSSKSVEISAEEYDALVEVPDKVEDTAEVEVSVSNRGREPEYENSKPEDSEVDYVDRLKDYVKDHIDEGYDLFMWDKYVYVNKRLVEKLGITTNKLKKVRIIQNGELKIEGDYLVLYASEVIDKALRKKVMQGKMKDEEKRNLFTNLKVEVLS